MVKLLYTIHKHTHTCAVTGKEDLQLCGFRINILAEQKAGRSKVADIEPIVAFFQAFIGERQFIAVIFHCAQIICK